MFERFTTDARTVVVQAQEQARRLEHGHIGAAHLLLALIQPNRTKDLNRTATDLREAGLHPDAVEQIVTRSEHRPQRVDGPLTSDDEDALRSLGIDLGTIRSSVEASFGAGALDRPGPARRPRLSRWLRHRLPLSNVINPSSHIPFTPGAKKSLELSLREALQLGDHQITADHIALGILSADDAGVTALLSTIGVDRNVIRERLIGRKRRSA